MTESHPVPRLGVAQTVEDRAAVREAAMKQLGWREQTASSRSARKRMAIRRKTRRR